MVAQGRRLYVAVDFDFFPVWILLVFALAGNELALILEIDAPDVVHISYLNVPASVNEQFVILDETAVVSAALRLRLLLAELPPVRLKGHVEHTFSRLRSR